MDRYLSSILFTADFSGGPTPTRKCYELQTAAGVGFKEKWLQEAIAKDPEIVLAACRAGGLIDKDEKWAFWKREFSVKDVGTIDVLLVSESGRIAIVETKLAYNPEARRTVVAQLLEYAIHLPSVPISELPEIPKSAGGQLFVEQEDLEENIHAPLLIIAGDQLDPRAVKLGNALLGKHLIHGWDLALVEVAVFQQKSDAGTNECLLVPHLSGAVAVEERKVVHVVIDEKRTKVEVEQIAGPVTVNRQKWDEERFFAEAERAAPLLREFASKLRHLRDRYKSDVTFDFGTSKGGSVSLKKKGNSILEFNLNDGERGFIRFRRDKIAAALGEDADHYLTTLNNLFPGPMEQAFPLVYLDSNASARVLSLLEEALGRSASEQTPAQAALGLDREEDMSR
jgi:hypothetical protein